MIFINMSFPKQRLAPTIAFLFFLLFSLSNCSTSSNLANTQLIGTWQEKEPQDAVQMAGTGHYFKFNPDKTFQLEQQNWTDSVTSGDPCGFNRTDYIKGTYKIKGSSIKLSGKYYDAGFKTPTPNCKGQTSFSNSYVSTFNTEVIIMNSDEETLSRQIRLIKQ